LNEKELRWRTALGEDASGADLMLSELHGDSARDDPALLVYLNSGHVEKVYPADAVSVHRENVYLLYEGQTVATYARREVMFCTRTVISPFAN
jgi:hypothetical protein